MKVAMETTTAISQGLRSPAAERLSRAGHSSWPLIAHRILTVGTTDMPGPSSTSGGSSNTILTGTRWTILTKLPVAFSAGSRLNAVPLPAWMLSTWPLKLRSG